MKKFDKKSLPFGVMLCGVTLCGVTLSHALQAQEIIKTEQQAAKNERSAYLCDWRYLWSSYARA